MHQHAAASDQAAPVGVAELTQGRDGAADAEVVGHLLVLLLGLGADRVWQRAGQRCANRLAVARTVVRARARVGVQALHHLQCEGLSHAARAHALDQWRGIDRLRAMDPVEPQVGAFACRVGGGHPLGQTAQVFDQHHAQGRRQRPQLAQVELTGLLEACQEFDQQRFIKGRIGVRNEGPGQAVDARQTSQRGIGQQRQIAEVATWQSVVDFLGLGHDQIEVVQQPLTGRAEVVAAAILQTDEVVCLVQHADVLLQTREESQRPPRLEPGRAAGLPLAQAQGAKAFAVEDVGTERRLQSAAGRIEQRKPLRVGKARLPTCWCTGRHQFSRWLLAMSRTVSTATAVTRRGATKPVTASTTQCRRCIRPWAWVHWCRCSHKRAGSIRSGGLAKCNM